MNRAGNAGQPRRSRISTFLRAFSQRWARHGFERQIKALLAPLYRTAYRLTGSQADAEDLVQDALVNALQSFERAGCAAPEDVKAWMFTILANCFRDRYRRRRRSPEVALAPIDDDASNVIELMSSADPGPAELIEAASFRAAAQIAINRLPPEVRLAVTLYFVEDRTYQEIADITDCPVGTVMSRLWRGRRALRQALARFAAGRDVAATGIRGEADSDLRRARR